MAEKFSKFRDPGTGIQVFLTPVAASTSVSSNSSSSAGPLGLILTPIFIVLGLVRALIVGLFWGLYLLTGSAPLLRIVLGALGFWTLAVESVAPGGSRRSGKQAPSQGISEGKKGDLVLANHSSWLDLLILSCLCPGIRFIVPVLADGVKDEAIKPDASGAAARRTPKKNAMSANTRIVTPSSPSPSSATEPPIQGYTSLSLTQALPFVGSLPPSVSQVTTPVHPDLHSTVQSSSTALALFPEVVTSNNRALLSISPTILPSNPPSTLRSTQLVTLKYSPPSPLSTTSVYSVPGPTNSKLKHLAQLIFLSSPIRGVSIRLSKLDKETAGSWGEEVAGGLSTMGRFKRTAIGWWSKKEFLEMVRGRNKRI